MWIPSHLGFRGNEKVDEIVNQVAQQSEQFVPVPYRDWFTTIRRKAYELWREEWQKETRDLRKLKPLPGKWLKNGRKVRQEEVIINRLRPRHTRLTQGYLFDGRAEGDRPICVVWRCNTDSESYSSGL